MNEPFMIDPTRTERLLAHLLKWYLATWLGSSLLLWLLLDWRVSFGSGSSPSWESTLSLGFQVFVSTILGAVTAVALLMTAWVVWRIHSTLSVARNRLERGSDG